jgi:hypothetical protein
VVVRSAEGGYTTLPANIRPGDFEGEPPPESLPEEAVPRGAAGDRRRRPEEGGEEVGVGVDRTEATAVTPPRRFGGFFRPWHRPAGNS